MNRISFLCAFSVPAARGRSLEAPQRVQVRVRMPRSVSVGTFVISPSSGQSCSSSSV